MSPIEETHHQKRRRTPTGEKGPSSHLPLPLPISHLPLRSSSFNSISRLELSSLPRLPALLKDSPVSFVCDLLNAGSDPYTLTPSFDNYRGQETLSPGFVSFILSEQEPYNQPWDSTALLSRLSCSACVLVSTKSRISLISQPWSFRTLSHRTVLRAVSSSPQINPPISLKETICHHLPLDPSALPDFPGPHLAIWTRCL